MRNYPKKGSADSAMYYQIVKKSFDPLLIAKKNLVAYYKEDCL